MSPEGMRLLTSMVSGQFKDLALFAELDDFIDTTTRAPSSEQINELFQSIDADLEQVIDKFDQLAGHAIEVEDLTTARIAIARIRKTFEQLHKK